MAGVLHVRRRSLALLLGAVLLIPAAGGPVGAGGPEAQSLGATLLWRSSFRAPDDDPECCGRDASADEVTAVAADFRGNVYVVGWTASSLFPTKNAFQPQSVGGIHSLDAFALKIDRYGELQFSTFLSGHGRSRAQGVAVDWKGNMYIAGITEAADFPTQNGTQAALAGGSDAFLVKLGPDGDFLQGTFFGGTGNETRVSLARGAADRMVLAGTTDSPDLPRAGAPQDRLAGGADGFVAVLDLAERSVLSSTYLGGAARDEVTDVAVNNSGDLRLAGFTYSADFPTTLGDPPADMPEGFAAALDPASGTLAWSRLLGGAGLDAAFGVAVDGAGDAVVVGRTRSPDFPTLDPVQPDLQGASDAFLTKLDVLGGIVSSTYVGGSSCEEGMSVALDAGRNPWLAGASCSRDFPLRNSMVEAPKDDWPFVAPFFAEFDLVAGCVGMASFTGLSAAVWKVALALNRDGDIALGGGVDRREVGFAAGIRPIGGNGQTPCTRLDLTGTKGLEGWWVSPVEVTLTAHCACPYTGPYHRLDGGPEQEGTPFTMATDGDHLLEWRSLGPIYSEPWRSTRVAVDRTPPTLDVQRPVRGGIYLQGTGVEAVARASPLTIVAGDLNVTALAFDAVSGVARVDFLVDGSLAGSDATLPYTFLWRAGQLPHGRHALEVVAFDVAGNRASQSVDVHTAPGPPVQLFAPVPGLPPTLPPPAPAPGPGGAPRVGAHLHSAWLDPGSPLSTAQLATLTRHARLEILAVGIPLGGPQSQELAGVTSRGILDALDVPSVVELNTFRLSEEQQNSAALRALFAGVAGATRGHPHLNLVVGANEPLSAARRWLAPEEAEARVALEHALWQEVSDAPFCHKFTAPRFNGPGLGWAAMERLWSEHQDALCYVWYPDTDSDATLAKVKDLGARLGKPVHILEARVPGNDPATLARLASGTASFIVYPLLGTPTMDPLLGAWQWRNGRVQEAAPGAMLRAYVDGPLAS